jgi:hypothetical protein
MADDNPGYVPPPRGSNTALIIVLGVAFLLAMVCCGGVAFLGIALPVRMVEQQNDLKIPVPEERNVPESPPPTPAPDSPNP